MLDRSFKSTFFGIILRIISSSSQSDAVSFYKSISSGCRAMPLIEREHAVHILRNELPQIRNSIVEGWDAWLALPARQRAATTSGTRAGLVHDLIVDAASRRLETAHIMNRAGLRIFIFSGVIGVRFKKFDDDLGTRNQPTKQVEMFRGQQQLGGVPANHYLDAGYILDDSELAIAGVHLVCPNGERPYWSIGLHEHGYECQAEDLFAQNGPGIQEGTTERETSGARWRRRDTGTIVPFNRRGKHGD